MHLLPTEIESTLFLKGYFLIHIGCKGDAQVINTAYHKDSKAVYRKKEMQLMLDDLTENRNKIPQLSRDQKMQVFNYAWDEVYTKIDCVDAHNKTMMTLAFNGSEDHLANKKLMELVGKDILAFREELIKPVSTYNEGVKEATNNTKGFRRGKQSKNFDKPLPDEGTDLYDGDGDALDKDVEESHESGEESDLDDHEEQNDQTTTETEELVPAVCESLVTDSRDLKLVRELLQKIMLLMM